MVNQTGVKVRRPATEAERAIDRIAAGAAARDCESSTLDFKEEKAVSKETDKILAEAAICFANTAGGVVVLGVSDKVKGTNAFTGTTLKPDQIKQRIYELTRPHLNVEAVVHSKYNSLILIHVQQSSDIHSDTQGRATRRINLDCIPMDPDQQARFREERRGLDWSSVSSDKSIDDISQETLSQVRGILSRFNDERRKLAALRKKDLLTALGVLSSGNTLNRAGEILLCEDDSNALIVYQYRNTPGGEPKNVSRLTTPYVSAFSRSMEFIAARRVSTPLNLPDGQQVTIEDFPRLAVREAISNAICHRDYHLEGPITIEHSPEIFSITSPGPLVSGVTPENIITTTSRPRNPALAKAARILGFAEELGRGVDRMYREMIRSGKQIPVIEASYDRVRVALVGGAPDTNIARFVATLPEAEQEDTDTMIVLLKLCQMRTTTAVSMSSFLQKSVEESEFVLKRLATEPVALLERTRATVSRSAGTYRLRSDALKKLGAAVVYQRRTADEIDKKVIAHVREYGKITNRTLQNVFDVHVFKARDIISDLVQRQILQRVSETARGTKVEWGAGPGFPITRKKKVGGSVKSQTDADQLPLWEAGNHDKE
ncbi:MAG: RNA-binding domain-containing protein [Janthinobacterium lividum]